MTDLLLAAATELDQRADELDPCSELAMAQELSCLAARLRVANRWFDYRAARPAGVCHCPDDARRSIAPTATPLVMTPKEAATMLRISGRSLARLEETGELRPRRRGRIVRYLRADVEAYANRDQEQELN